MAQSNASRDGSLTLDPVWLILRRPRPNFDPPDFFAPGQLTVQGEGGSFGPSDATLSWPGSSKSDKHLNMDRIIGVRRKRYGWGVVPRLIEITYEVPQGSDVAYFNDGAWKGWRPLVTGSNRRIVSAIRQYLGLT
jgi:hypothetical protein